MPGWVISPPWHQFPGLNWLEHKMFPSSDILASVFGHGSPRHILLNHVQTPVIYPGKCYHNSGVWVEGRDVSGCRVQMMEKLMKHTKRRGWLAGSRQSWKHLFGEQRGMVFIARWSQILSQRGFNWKKQFKLSNFTGGKVHYSNVMTIL